MMIGSFGMLAGDPEQVLVPVGAVVVDLDRPAVVGEDLEQLRDLARLPVCRCDHSAVDLDPDDAGRIAPAVELSRDASMSLGSATR